MATILGIESTCDETAAAVVAGGYDVRADVVASQADLHAKYRGVVPEIASRAHIENILPVVREAVTSACRGDACVARPADGGDAPVGATPASPAARAGPLLPQPSSAPGEAGLAPTRETRATQASPLRANRRSSPWPRSTVRPCSGS